MSTQRVYRTDPTQFTPHVFAAAASAWVTSTAYVVGSLVTNSGSTYFCIVAHTSGTFATDLAAAKWLLVTASVWTPQNVGTGAGRVSAVWDRGTGDLPTIYSYRCSARWAATVAAGDAHRLYLLSSHDGATAALSDGNIAPGDAALTSEANISQNCRYPINGPVAATATDQLWEKSGEVELFPRYLFLAGWNSSSTKALTNTATDHWCMFTPTAYALQAAS